MCPYQVISTTKAVFQNENSYFLIWFFFIVTSEIKNNCSLRNMFCMIDNKSLISL